MALFGSKAWVNVFEQMSIFRLFELLLLFGLGRRLFLLEYCKRHFPSLYCLKRKLGKMAFFGPNAWVNPFGKMPTL